MNSIDNEQFLMNIAIFMKQNNIAYLTRNAYEELCIRLEDYSQGELYANGKDPFDNELSFSLGRYFKFLIGHEDNILILNHNNIYSKTYDSNLCDFFETNKVKEVFGQSNDIKQNNINFCNALSVEEKLAIAKSVEKQF